MTRKRVVRSFCSVIAYLAGMILIGVSVSASDDTEKRVIFTTFKDLLPLFIAIPAAWLSYCIQRRSAFLQQLRSLWTRLIDAVQTAHQYTHADFPSQEAYASVLVKLSTVIDEVRGLFLNLGETEAAKGHYPFEPLKDIYALIAELRWGDSFSTAKAEEARKHVDLLWKDVRRVFLKEFDREVPSFAHCHWKDAENRRIYDQHGIPKKPT